MESRLPKIFQIISNENKTYELKEMSDYFNVTERTILNDIEQLNRFLKKAELNEITVKNRQIQYSEYLPISFVDILQDKRELLFIDGDIRKKVLILEAILHIEDFNVSQLASKFGLSRNTIIAEIKDIKKVFSSQELHLFSVPFKGYAFQGDEQAIRKLLVSLYPVAKLNIFEETITIDDGTLEEMSESIFNHLNRRVSQESFDRTVAYFWATYQRVADGNFIHIYKGSSRDTSIECEAIESNPLFQKYFSHLSLNEEEISYLSHRIAEASLIGINENTSDDWLYWNFITIDFINCVAEKFSEPFFLSDRKLFQGLLTHLRPAIRRLQAGEEFTNPMYAQVIAKYSKLNTMVLRTLTDFENKFDIGFTLQEASFITLFFAASLERNKVTITPSIKIIIVCNEGLSTSQILKSKLEKNFDFIILGTFSKRGAEDWIQKNGVDFVVSTIDVATDDIPLIKVTPMLTLGDIEYIKKITHIASREVTIDEVMNIFDKHVQVSDESKEQIYFDLKKLFQMQTAPLKSHKNAIQRAG